MAGGVLSTVLDCKEAGMMMIRQVWFLDKFGDFDLDYDNHYDAMTWEVLYFMSNENQSK